MKRKMKVYCLLFTPVQYDIYNRINVKNKIDLRIS